MQVNNGQCLRQTDRAVVDLEEVPSFEPETDHDRVTHSRRCVQ